MPELAHSSQDASATSPAKPSQTLSTKHTHLADGVIYPFNETLSSALTEQIIKVKKEYKTNTGIISGVGKIYAALQKKHMDAKKIQEEASSSWLKWFYYQIYSPNIFDTLIDQKRYEYGLDIIHKEFDSGTLSKAKQWAECAFMENSLATLDPNNPESIARLRNVFPDPEILQIYYQEKWQEKTTAEKEDALVSLMEKVKPHISKMAFDKAYGTLYQADMKHIPSDINEYLSTVITEKKKHHSSILIEQKEFSKALPLLFDIVMLDHAEQNTLDLLKTCLSEITHPDFSDEILVERFMKLKKLFPQDRWVNNELIKYNYQNVLTHVLGKDSPIYEAVNQIILRTYHTKAAIGDSSANRLYADLFENLADLATKETTEPSQIALKRTSALLLLKLNQNENASFEYLHHHMASIRKIAKEITAYKKRWGGINSMRVTRESEPGRINKAYTLIQKLDKSFQSLVDCTFTRYQGDTYFQEALSNLFVFMVDDMNPFPGIRTQGGTIYRLEKTANDTFAKLKEYSNPREEEVPLILASQFKDFSFIQKILKHLGKLLYVEKTINEIDRFIDYEDLLNEKFMLTSLPLSETTAKDIAYYHDVTTSIAQKACKLAKQAKEKGDYDSAMRYCLDALATQTSSDSEIYQQACTTLEETVASVKTENTEHSEITKRFLHTAQEYLTFRDTINTQPLMWALLPKTAIKHPTDYNICIRSEEHKPIIALASGNVTAWDYVTPFMPAVKDQLTHLLTKIFQDVDVRFRFINDDESIFTCHDVIAIGATPIDSPIPPLNVKGSWGETQYFINYNYPRFTGVITQSNKDPAYQLLMHELLHSLYVKHPKNYPCSVDSNMLQPHEALYSAEGTSSTTTSMSYGFLSSMKYIIIHNTETGNITDCLQVNEPTESLEANDYRMPNNPEFTPPLDAWTIHSLFHPIPTDKNKDFHQWNCSSTSIQCHWNLRLGDNASITGEEQKHPKRQHSYDFFIIGESETPLDIGRVGAATYCIISGKVTQLNGGTGVGVLKAGRYTQTMQAHPHAEQTYFEPHPDPTHAVVINHFGPQDILCTGKLNRFIPEQHVTPMENNKGFIISITNTKQKITINFKPGFTYDDFTTKQFQKISHTGKCKIHQTKKTTEPRNIVLPDKENWQRQFIHVDGKAHTTIYHFSPERGDQIILPSAFKQLDDATTIEWSQDNKEAYIGNHTRLVFTAPPETRPQITLTFSSTTSALDSPSKKPKVIAHEMPSSVFLQERVK